MVMVDNNIISELKDALVVSGGVLPSWFVEDQARKANVTYFKLSDKTRVCLMGLEFGLEIVGKSIVLDAKRDVMVISEEAAFEDAKRQLVVVLNTLVLGMTNGRFER